MRSVQLVPADVLGQPPWAPPRVPPAGPLPPSCDVLIAGAGVTGLRTALAFAATGSHVVVVDREFGGGATPRSGGIIVGDTLVGPAPGFEGCDADLRAWVAAHAPECDLRSIGCWELERGADAPPGALGWQDAGHVRVTGTVDGGTIDPAALVGALARVAAEQGVQFAFGVSVDDCHNSAKGFVAQCGDREVRSSAVVMCVDATARPTDAPDPWPQRLLTIALETDVVTNGTAAAIGWSDRRPFYTNELPLLWGRSLADGAMIAGRELVSIENDRPADLPAAIAAAGARLTARIRGLHPALATLGVRRIWAGPIARDARGVPAIVADPNVPGVWWVGGYGGHGLAQAFRLGGRVPATIAAARQGQSIGDSSRLT